MTRLRTVVYHRARAPEIAGALRDDPRLAELDPVATRDPAELEVEITSAEILVTSNGLPAKALQQAHQLKWIHVAAAGVDGVVVPELPEGVRVTRTRGTFGARMTEYVCAHLLAVAQDVHGLRQQQRAGVWQPRPVTHLHGKTVGVAGVGNIGGVIAERLSQFGMIVHGLARRQGDLSYVQRWFTPSERQAFVSDLDFLVITLPLTPATKHFFDRSALRAMKPGAWLVNVGRGPVVDEAELVSALRDGALGGAVLDVFEHEPLCASSPLWSLPNAILTPHQAGDALAEEVADALARNLENWKADEPLVGEVDLAQAY